MANGYSIGTTTTNTVSSMGAQGLPMSSALPIIVNESTPNLAEIQSFPVIVSGGGIHIHQDPVTGQRYRMTDEFHSRIPQILAGNSSAIGMKIKINTEDGIKEFSVMELWNQSYNDYRYTSTFFDQLREYTSIIGTVENNIINNLLRGRLDRYFKTTVTRPGTISTTMTDSGIYSEKSVNTSVNYFSRNGFVISSRFVIPNTKLSTLSSIQPTRPVTNAFSASSNFKNRYVLRIDKKYGTLSSIQPTRPVTNAFSASSNFKNRYVLRIDKKYG
jgi:hypothetical protein